MLYEGIGRFDKSVEQYRCFAFTKLCKDIAKEVVDQVENYIQWGYKIPAFLAIDGSPSCGLNLTQSAPEWRGRVVEMNWEKARFIKKPGIFMEALQKELKHRNLDIPLLGIPELPELGSLDEILELLEEVLTTE